VTEDWYFVSHRLPMARAAKQAGFDVHVATRVQEHAATIEREGFVLHPLNWRRGSLNPLHFFCAIREVRNLYRQTRPALAHHVAQVPTIVGSLAALGLPIVCLNALAGLGFAFAMKTPKALLLRAIIEPLLRWLLTRRRAAVLVQNPDDRAVIESLGVCPDKIFLIPGSGVDVDKLIQLPEPPAPITVGFLGRLLKDKGVPILVAAHELLARSGRPIKLLIAGEPDPANPASIPLTVIARWRQRPGITLVGHVEDIGAFWAKSHIAALPSRREGLPLSLMEAAACGRPLVATDVPGCREIAHDGVNALLVPPDDAIALANAIDQLARDTEMRLRFGKAGRALVEREFSSERVGHDVVMLYDRILGRRPSIGSEGGSRDTTVL
jgi:glycosyltransferase involved in cell wall biosynthesis